MSQEPLERNESDVRRLLRTIDLEYQAAHLALSGLCIGTSMHEFITARMERIENTRQELVDIVGPDEATRLVVDQMNKSDEAKGEQS